MYAILADERTRDWFRATAGSTLTILALSGSLPAQTSTSWRTTAGSGAWGTSGNWTAGTPSATTTAEFSTSNFTSIDLGTTNRHARGLYFHPGANGFTFGGTRALYLYSDGVVVDGGSQRINSWRVAMQPPTRGCAAFVPHAAPPRADLGLCLRHGKRTPRKAARGTAWGAIPAARLSASLAEPFARAGRFRRG